MKGEWLQHTILRAASLLAPGDQRAEWLEEWRAELWYVPRRRATLFCLGSFRDALWLQWNRPGPVKRTGIHLESPMRCLGVLAALAAVSLLIAFRLPGKGHQPWPSHMTLRDVPTGCIAMLSLSCLLLPATRLAMGRDPANHSPAPWPQRLRGGIFLALKIALVQPIMLCVFLFTLTIGAIPMAPSLAMFAVWSLGFRWTLTDQRRRCPVCLRLLSEPVRIGSPAETFLGWYGVESMCSHGHGLLHDPEIASSYAGKRWLKLDGSWSGLFSGAAKGRP